MIDTALFIAGALTAGMYFRANTPDEVELRERVDALYLRIDWRWAQEGAMTIRQGWKPECGFLHYGWEGYSEAIVLYVLALALRLSNLLVRHGEPAADGGCMLPFRLSQEDLGSLIGVTREAVGRVLRKWANEGWVDLGYARMVVRDPGALRRLLLPLGEGAPDTSAPLSPSPARAGR